MGLSDETRVNYIYWSLLRLNRLNRNIDNLKIPSIDKEEIAPLCKFIDSLWHIFIGSQSNDSHWIFGSGSDRRITKDSLSPWAIAIKYRCSEAVKEDEDSDSNNELRDKFNPFDSFLSIQGLIRSKNKLNSLIFQVYQEAEQLIYPLRRYDDDFLKYFEELNKVVSAIQGFCFDRFSSYDDFSKAYMLHHICVILYGNDTRFTYDEEKDWDEVTTWLYNDHIHHYLSLAMDNVYGKTETELANIHKGLVKKHDKIDRILAAISLCGHNFDDFRKKTLFSFISKNRSLMRKKSLIEQAVAECIKQHNEFDKELKTEDCSLDVYGE